VEEGRVEHGAWSPWSSREKAGRTAGSFVSAEVVGFSCLNSNKLINVIRRENESQNRREKF
jgi:hypothetical protein